MINEVNLDSVEKPLIMDLFLKNPTATRRSNALAVTHCNIAADSCSLFCFIIAH